MFGCSSSQNIRYQEQEGCGRVKVPLPLAGKQAGDHRGGNVHIWRVYLSCKTEGSIEKGDLKLQKINVRVIFKGFVRKSGEPYEIDMPYVILLKDEIANLVLGKVRAETKVSIGKGEKTREKEVSHLIIPEYDQGLGRKNIYPTIFVGLQLSEGEWRRYKKVIESTGERALIAD